MKTAVRISEETLPSRAELQAEMARTRLRLSQLEQILDEPVTSRHLASEESFEKSGSSDNLLLKRLQLELEQRRCIEQELLQVHNELEQRVADRTRDLEISRDRYSSLYDLAPLAYITFDNSGTIREINLTGAALLGHERDELIDRPFAGHVRKENIRLFYGHMQRCRNQRKKVASELYLRLPNDDFIPVILQSVPEEIDNGETRYRTAIIDISERKLAEEKVLRLNRLYMMLSRTNEAIVRAANEKALFWDACRICVNHGGFRLAWIGLLEEGEPVIRPVAACGDGIESVKNLDGLTVDSTIFRTIDDAVSTARFRICDRRDSESCITGNCGLLHACAAFPLKLNGVSVGALVLGARPDDSFDEQMLELLHQMTADISFALDNFEKEARQWAAERALQREITERLQMVEELRRKEQLLTAQSRRAAMGEMISNISHQWRQPLNVLGLIIQELPYRFEAGELTEEYLEESVNRLKKLIFHMSQTIDDFRNFFRPDKEKSSFRVADVIQRTLYLIDASFKEQQIRLTVQVEPDLEIHGYPNEFSQVLLNILLNGKDAFIERGISGRRMEVQAVEEKGHAIVTLTDNAGGIREEILEKVFDPYFTTKGPDKGTGLGLFMSKMIIEKNMNGSISVKNHGDGCCFTIVI